MEYTRRVLIGEMIVLNKKINSIENIVDDITTDDMLEHDIYIIGGYESIRDALALIIKNTELAPFYLNLTPPEYDMYDKEFSISWCYETGELFVEKLFSDSCDSYLGFECDAVFLMPDVSNALRDYIKSLRQNIGIIINLSYDDSSCVDDNDDCCFVDVSRDADGFISGFTKISVHDDGYTSISYFSNDANNILETAKSIGIDIGC